MIPGYGGNLFNLEPVAERVTVSHRATSATREAMERARARPGLRLPPRGPGRPRPLPDGPVPGHRHQRQGHGRRHGGRSSTTTRRRASSTRGRAASTGPAVSLPVAEDAPTNPRGIYEISNLTAEKIVEVYDRVHGIPSVAPAPHERLRPARADEALALRRRELVRAPRARRRDDEGLRRRDDQARLPLRRRLRRGDPPRGRARTRARGRGPERRRRTCRRRSGSSPRSSAPSRARAGSSRRSRPSARRRSRATSTRTSRRSAASSAGRRGRRSREGLERTLAFYRLNKAHYW